MQNPVNESQATDWEKIFENHTPDNRSGSCIYEEFLSLTNKETTQFKRSKGFGWTFCHKEYTGWHRDKHMKDAQHPWPSGKWVERYHFTPPRGLKLGRRTTVSVSKNMEQLELSYMAGRNIKWCNHFERCFGSFLKSKVKKVWQFL